MAKLLDPTIANTNVKKTNSVFSAIGNALKNSTPTSSPTTQTVQNGNTGSVFSAANNSAPKTPAVTSYNQPFFTGSVNSVKTTAPAASKTPAASSAGSYIPSSLPSLKPIGSTALGGSGNKVTQPVNLSSMDRNAKVDAMNNAGVPNVYNDDVAQKILDNMYATGLDYDKTKQFMKTYGDTSIYGQQDDTDQDVGSGNGASVRGNNDSLYNDIMAMFMEQNNAARQQMIDAIMGNLGAVKSEYKAQIQNVIDQYQDLINQNEVQRDRTRRRIRENQANRGQLGSGLGRQEQLYLDTTYDTNEANLESAREKAVQEIMTLITQAEAEANANKAQVNSNYDNALLEWKLANQ